MEVTGISKHEHEAVPLPEESPSAAEPSEGGELSPIPEGSHEDESLGSLDDFLVHEDPALQQVLRDTRAVCESALELVEEEVVAEAPSADAATAEAPSADAGWPPLTYLNSPDLQQPWDVKTCIWFLMPQSFPQITSSSTRPLRKEEHAGWS